MNYPPPSLKLRQPTVYLDQWVWIRLARANLGRPHHKDDVQVLNAVREAALKGIAFPLSATHYEETGRITDPKQREALARVMAPISQMQTLCAHAALLRHQFLVALHETAGRPTFRPANPKVIGVGAHWAFVGNQAFFKLLDPDGRELNVPNFWLRHLNQYGETALLAGPSDGELPDLLSEGYVMPRDFESREGNRLAWEQLLTENISKRQTSRPELRAIVLARELAHEYLDLLNQLFAEYRLSLATITSGKQGMKSRAKAIAFAEHIPTMRISADLKVEVLRDKGRTWSWNMLRDIDALSIAIPYCHVVIADRDAVALLRRTGADKRHDTVVTASLEELRELLTDLTPQDPSLGTPWDALGKGDGQFHVEAPDPLSPGTAPQGASLRMVDSSGRPVRSPIKA